MKKENYGIIHQVAYCLSCDGRNEDYENGNARKWAYRHAKSTGHKVSVETGTAFQYN